MSDKTSNYIDMLIEASHKELREYVMCDALEYPEDEYRSRLSKAYKISIMTELDSIIECDANDNGFGDFAKSLISICNGKPLEFLYQRWIEDDTLSSIRDDLRLCMQNI